MNKKNRPVCGADYFSGKRMTICKKPVGHDGNHGRRKPRYVRGSWLGWVFIVVWIAGIFFKLPILAYTIIFIIIIAFYAISIFLQMKSRRRADERNQGMG